MKEDTVVRETEWIEVIEIELIGVIEKGVMKMKEEVWRLQFPLHNVASMFLPRKVVLSRER